MSFSPIVYEFEQYIPSMHPVDNLISLWNNRHGLLSNVVTNSNQISHTSTSKTFGKLCVDLLRQLKKPTVLASLSISGILLYIIIPSAFPGNHDNRSIAKRPDKYTTGLINPSVDCFANSNMQALASLPKFNSYLKSFNDVYRHIMFASRSLNIAYLPGIPLHLAMIDMLSELQSTIYSPRSISVWDFLHVLERIHNSHIARNQSDAHELLQIILETLLTEYQDLRKVYDSSAQLRSMITLPFPRFPFTSEVESHFQCLRCGGNSSLNRNSMMIFSLSLPESSSVEIDEILRNSGNEIIKDYSCLICKVKYILATKDQLIQKRSELQKVGKLEKLLVTGSLLINSDLDPDLESFINNYPKINTPEMKSDVHRQIDIIEPPEILILHISRSLFEYTQAWKNSCNVIFDNTIDLKVSETHLRYELRSLIVHLGSHSSGHYECYRKKPVYYKNRNTGRYYQKDYEEFDRQRQSIPYGNRDKKLRSCVNKPYWKTSDKVISECSSEAVISEGCNVSIIFYEY